MATMQMLFRGGVCFLSAAAGFFLVRMQKRKNSRFPAIPAWLLFVLPFASGGFYSYLGLPVSCILLWELFRSKKLRVYRNICTIAIAVTALLYLLSPLWAVDKGMAPFGMLHAVPLVLYAAVISQLEPSEKEDVYALLPAAGTATVLLSLIFSLIPGTRDFVTVNSRLAGFFEYPNTFALFLLVCLSRFLCKEKRNWADYFGGLCFILGIFLSGSRTAFLLMLLLAAAVIIRKGSKRLPLIGILLGSGLIAVLIGGFFGLSGTRFLLSNLKESTFLGRLLYDRDALRIILQHPFGLGYYGYLSIQGSYQTGVYSVAYVHNELLQIMLDIGILPGILLTAAIVHAFFGKNTSFQNKLILLLISAHSMMDFNLQFLSIWFLLIPALTLHEGSETKIRNPMIPIAAGGILAASLSFLALGDFFYTAGAMDLCRKVTPLHTLCLTNTLDLTDPAAAKKQASTIIEQNPYNTNAYVALASLDFSAGNVLEMSRNMEKALDCSPYNISNYCLYFDYLDYVRQLYLQSHDMRSVEFCLKKMEQIPIMLQAVEQRTSPLAWQIQDLPQLELPEAYLERLEAAKFG